LAKKWSNMYGKKIIGLGGVPKKSKEARMVLRLMDKDYSYQDALKTVLALSNKTKRKLEKELNYYI
jgi:hypothetical protein